MKRNAYEILQIRPEAEQEVVDAVYRRLCRKYHPDVNADQEAVRRMHQITEAYSVLGDPEKRRQYDTQLQRSARALPSGRETGASGERTPETLMTLYFGHLRDREWHKAYRMLTAEDRQRINLADFIDWQEAVGALYAIGDVRVSVFRTHRDAAGPVAIELLAEGIEIDLRQDEARAFSTIKTMRREGEVWHVWLGHEDVRGLADRFKLLAGTRHPRIVGWDALLALVGEEAYRTRRFGHPLSLVAFMPMLPGGEDEALWRDRSLRWMAVASDRLRRSDRLCWLEEGCGVLLLPDTTLRQAHAAARKWEKALLETALEEVDALPVAWCASDYTGLSVPDWLEQLLQRLRQKQVQMAGKAAANG